MENDTLVDQLRDAFKRVRYGGDGPYIPEGDLFDMAADRIEELEGRRASQASTDRPTSELGGRERGTEPAACCVLAGYFDDICGEWCFEVVTTPLYGDYTHWWPLPDLAADTITALEAKIAETEAERDRQYGENVGLIATIARLQAGREFDIAAMIASAEEWCGDEEDGETAEGWFQHYRRLLPKGATEEHCGDCTNVPMSCLRCHTDDYLERARATLLSDAPEARGEGEQS